MPLGHADWIIDRGRGAATTRPDRLRGDTGRPCRRPRHPHRRAPRGLRHTWARPSRRPW